MAFVSEAKATPAQEVLDRVVTNRAWVPQLWRLEVANSLLVAVRRNRIDKAFRDASLADLARLRIQVDVDMSSFAWSTTLELAEKHDLTLYAAAYLELALRLSLPLATRDEALRAAARECQVPTLGA